jgi:ATP-dependent helicase/nuclease subunit A
MGTLRVIRAGAGSGKTTRLCEVIAEAVASGLDPARLLATTFTRKAAAELKGRIQERLLTHPGLGARARTTAAERLELAAIGTVHSVGHQLLSRYALPLGFSPRLAVLEEAGSSRALHDLLGRMDLAPWVALAALTKRLSLGSPQALVLDLLDAKRGNRIEDEAFRVQLRSGGTRLCALMAPGGRTEPGLSFEAFYARVAAVLDAIERLQDDTKTTREARRQLARILAARSGAWADFCWAAGIGAGKRSGADALLAPLRAEAAAVLGSRLLHQDIGELLDRLAERTLTLEREYALYKRERGLLDFTDLEVWLLRLLETPALAVSVARDFALVVVDEFHDTNPLQLAIFQRLRWLVDRSYWVGDGKQSIFGFRGTDPELIHAVWDAAPEAARDRLPKNYRSQAGLVQLTGRLFRPLFGEEAMLSPDHPGKPRGVERWILGGKNVEEEARALAAGIRTLRDEGRSLRDVAILTRTNAQAQRIGAACRALGLPVLLELPGLLLTREGALTLAGLQLAVDRSDSLAAATILHLLEDPDTETPSWLAERLRALRAAEEAQAAPSRPWQGHPAFAPLEAIDHRTLPPTVALQRVLDALRVGDHLRSWGNPAQRLANLDALVLLAQAYEQERQILGAAATLPGLVAYLTDLSDQATDFTRAPYGIDAVTILTYHSAKGLEWPVVVLSGLEVERDPDMWKVTVGGGDPGAEEPLAGRMIRYWPWPFGSRSAGTDLADRALTSPEGQAAAARAAAECNRLLYVGFTRAKDTLVLAHREGRYAWLASLPGIDTLLPPDAPEGEHRLEDLETTFVLRRPGAPPDGEVVLQADGEQRWLAALGESGAHTAPIRRYYSPSAVEASAPEAAIAAELLPGEPVFPKVAEAQEADLGQAIHAYLTALPCMAHLPPDRRGAIAVRCLLGFGVEALLTPGALVEMGDRFQKWVEARYPGATWHTEVPLTAPRKGGGQWLGSADLLLRLPAGELVIVDHKCGPVRREQCAKKAATYAGQIRAYQETLASQEAMVRETWIHFPLAGVLTSLSLE